MEIDEGVIPVIRTQIGGAGIPFGELETEHSGRELHRLIHVRRSDPDITDVVQGNHWPPSPAGVPAESDGSHLIVSDH
jgi:hypothetical protein